MNDSINKYSGFFGNSNKNAILNGVLSSHSGVVGNKAPEAFGHQKETTQFILRNERVLCFSDPGTGKTRAVLDAINERAKETGGRVLVLAPKTIIKPAWEEDILKFTPELNYCIASAKNRRSAFESTASVILTNHDAVKSILGFKELLEDFDTLVIDESTAYKHFSAQRSKALVKLANSFKFRIAMTGTPTPNSICDIWHQVYIIDGGARLGKSYFKFRTVSCINQNAGSPFPHWVDKPGIEETVADALADITIRYKLEECVEIPECFSTVVRFDMEEKQKLAYQEMVRHSLITVDLNTISADRAAVLGGKLLQMASGNVYDEEGETVKISTERANLITELVMQRDHCIIAFLWSHQKEALMQAFDRKNISYHVIDGSVKDADRAEAVSDFQKGLVKVMLCHPKTTAHGLTLTRGTTAIWASPTYNAEWLEQFNRRIYRLSQKQKTEIVHVIANGTIDEQACSKVMGKQMKMLELLRVVKENFKANN